MKAQPVKKTDIHKKWILVDAEGQVLGRLASEISRILRGKNKPTFVPYWDCGDNVIVINAEKIKLTGNKLVNKIYYKHSGYPGGLKAKNAEEMLAFHPDRLIKLAVRGMLPKNKLSRKIINNLKIYAGSVHPHQAQNPEPLSPRIAKGV